MTEDGEESAAAARADASSERKRKRKRTARACTPSRLESLVNGAYRAKLLAYASSWYHGRKSELDVAQVFGLDPDELGGRIEVWARKMSVAAAR